MGGGSWTRSSFNSYATSKGYSVDSSTGAITDNLSTSQIYTSYKLHNDLNPKNIVRKCSDCDEHPNTVPVILALDVTGSMGAAAGKVAKQLNVIMTELYSKVKDVEFCIMGIGDLAYDNAPIQMSQFESDIRIAEHLDKIYFEGGGGGNRYESYSAAWYMGVHHTDLDCWKRGKKGIIITMGDEGPNPYLPSCLKEITGDNNIQSEVETRDLYNEVINKFNVYHLSVNDDSSSYKYHQSMYNIDNQWKKILGENYKVVNLDSLSTEIVNIVIKDSQTTASGINLNNNFDFSVNFDKNGEISW